MKYIFLILLGVVAYGWSSGMLRQLLTFNPDDIFLGLIQVFGMAIIVFFSIMYGLNKVLGE